MDMMDSQSSTSAAEKDVDWRNPTIAEIARESRVGTATVDRVLNGRGNVREVTREKVLAALSRLKLKPATPQPDSIKRIAFLTESGASFNATLEATVQQYCSGHPGVICPFVAIASSQLDPIKFANLIERTAEEADALVIVAREDLIINRAVRNVVARKVPIICLTTDLPSSGRTAYVGSDQASAGSTAAYLMGQMAGDRGGKILLVYSAPYRAQEERELGFRRVLRSSFTHLEIHDRVNSNDDSEHAYRNVMKYIEENGPPVGIYNTVGGNSGIGKALNEHGLVGKVLFIGHELNANSRYLLETGVMNFAIGHDVAAEVEATVRCVTSLLDKSPAVDVPVSRVRIYTKYSCN
jgi:LacI family transcriptional regulator